MANGNNEYKGRFRTIGTAPFVQGKNGQPELHCVLGEACKQKAGGLRRVNGGRGETAVLALTMPLKGRAEEIRKWFPAAQVADDGTVFVTVEVWGKDAERCAEQGEIVRLNASGYLWQKPWEGHDPVLTFTVVSLESVTPRQTKGAGGAAPQQYAAPAPASFAAPPQFGQQAQQQFQQPTAPVYQQPAQQPTAPAYQQPATAPAPAYQQPAAPAPQYQPAAQAPTYQQPAAAPAPAAPAQTAYGNADFAVIEDDDGELPF